MASILLLQGPNLNMLGRREPHIYGDLTLQQLHDHLQIHLATLHAGIAGDVPTLECFQSNSECALIEKIHAQFESDCRFLIFNPGAFTHTSVALRDAVLAVNLPLIELHISNVYRREPFRHKSFFSDIAVGVLSGLGVQGYYYALDYALRHVQQENSPQ